jgi:hypothetical protein
MPLVTVLVISVPALVKVLVTLVRGLVTVRMFHSIQIHTDILLDTYPMSFLSRLYMGRHIQVPMLVPVLLVLALVLALVILAPVSVLALVLALVILAPVSVLALVLALVTVLVLALVARKQNN